MATGTVKWFNPTKGYGFIGPDDGGSCHFPKCSSADYQRVVQQDNTSTVKSAEG